MLFGGSSLTDSTPCVGGLAKKITSRLPESRKPSELSISPLSCEIGIDPRNDLAKSAGLQHAFLDKQSRAADAL